MNETTQREALLVGYLTGYMEKQAKEPGTWDKITGNVSEWWDNQDEDKKKYLLGALGGGVAGGTVGGLTGGWKGAGLGALTGAAAVPGAMYGYDKLVRDPQNKLKDALAAAKLESDRQAADYINEQKSIEAAEAQKRAKLKDALAAAKLESDRQAADYINEQKSIEAAEAQKRAKLKDALAAAKKKVAGVPVEQELTRLAADEKRLRARLSDLTGLKAEDTPVEGLAKLYGWIPTMGVDNSSEKLKANIETSKLKQAKPIIDKLKAIKARQKELSSVRVPKK